MQRKPTSNYTLIEIDFLLSLISNKILQNNKAEILFLLNKLKNTLRMKKKSNKIKLKSINQDIESREVIFNYYILKYHQIELMEIKILNLGLLLKKIKINCQTMKS